VLVIGVPSHGFRETVAQAIAGLELSLLAKYAFTLAQRFNTFYHRYPVIKEPDERWRRARVVLTWMFIAQMRRAPMWAGMEALAHTLAYDGRVMGDAMASSPEPLRRWASLSVPTLVIDGGASPPWMRNAARTLAETLPNAAYRTLDGQDHGPASSVLGPVLAAFFAGRA